MLFTAKRGFHGTVSALARTRYTKPKPKPEPRSNVRRPTQETHHDRDLKVSAPIPPAAGNLECPVDHPLWQFFSAQKFMRKPEELDQKSRSWTIPELRRKSFEDLHSLWYTCLKERNILARENHLLLHSMKSSREVYKDVDERIRTTMWRIRHVLSERDWAFRLAQQDFQEHQAEFIKDFEGLFLQAEAAQDVESFEMLSRFQLAVFGISEYIDENTVDRKFVDGLKYLATLKLKKFASRNDSIQQLLTTSENKISDAGEAFIIFTSENSESAVEEACNAVKELREQGNAVSRYDELETVAEYVKQLAQTQLETETSEETK
ncbi:mitochondrial 54S ribosomal protein uL29m Ecym_1161 [Eremothecium cymbalariae DBVPG|uniref:Large ribosomal subunit protein uL29m n=1 Tax=Eremothecium cymbalariae (strain CBS 270.75 / DBVPG 7215 / KCTC 17166 / NRRL Y-17582) TaxID=931890 RepID=G8JMU7_ERECY|nr:hypothetical protein Ecym_1161 [Eremothecium cymbalariae DBVPG\